MEGARSPLHEVAKIAPVHVEQSSAISESRRQQRLLALAPHSARAKILGCPESH
jgi:hypothetical protein